MGIDEKKGIMGGASAETAGARIEDPRVFWPAVPRRAVFLVPLLERVVLVMAHPEVPREGFVLGGHRVKHRDLVVLRQPIAKWIERIALSGRDRVPTPSSTKTVRPRSASLAASVPPPAPEPTTT